VAGIGERQRRWWLLGAMSGVLGLVVLDETVVGVALATIRADLGTSQVVAHWVVNAYLLTFTCFVAVGGRLGDGFGHRRPFLAGVVLFGLASLAWYEPSPCAIGTASTCPARQACVKGESVVSTRR
jgi:MFS family permease